MKMINELEQQKYDRWINIRKPLVDAQRPEDPTQLDVYQIWVDMIRSCEDPSFEGYLNFGCEIQD